MGSDFSSGMTKTQAPSVGRAPHGQGVHDDLSLFRQILEARLVVRRGDVHQALEILDGATVWAVAQEFENKPQARGLPGELVQRVNAARAGAQPILDFGHALRIGQALQHLAHFP